MPKRAGWAGCSTYAMRYMLILAEGGVTSASSPSQPPCWAFHISADWINQPHYFVLFGFNVFTSMFQLGHESNINCGTRCLRYNWDTTEICLRCAWDTFEMCHATILRSAAACVSSTWAIYVATCEACAQNHRQYAVRMCVRVCMFVSLSVQWQLVACIFNAIMKRTIIEIASQWQTNNAQANLK